MCDKDSNMIYENLSEEEFYEKQIQEYEKDAKKFQGIFDKYYLRLLENKIIIVNSNEINNKHFNRTKFYEIVDSLNKEEDFINSHTRVSIIENKENEIMVIYPSDTSNNFGKVNVEIITSLSEFVDKVIYLKKSDEYKTFYRGHGNWEYELVPGIYREQNKHILENESDYIRNIIASYPKFFTNCKSALDFLSVLQHHAFPTRLLDFSENPLIALYMACSSLGMEHSDTIRIDVPNNSFKYYDSDTVSVLSNLAFAEDTFSIIDFHHNMKNEDEIIKSFNQRTDIKKLVHLIRNEKPFFMSEINPEHLENTIVFVKPKQDFDRITHQNGLFALFGINKNKKEMPQIEFMDPPCNITHFVIPSDCKKRIIEELASININEATVYCDMDHIASYYKNISKKNEIENIINKNDRILF